MACRPGPLRVERSLRDVYTGFAVGLLLVGMKISQATNGSLELKGYMRHEVTAARAGRPRSSPQRRLKNHITYPLNSALANIAMHPIPPTCVSLVCASRQHFASSSPSAWRCAQFPLLSRKHPPDPPSSATSPSGASTTTNPTSSKTSSRPPDQPP